MRFADFPLHPDLLRGIEAAGYGTCMPVQEQSLQFTLEGRDIFVQSQTGSGKTAAFLVALFQSMLEAEPQDRGMALIISPTRELALQIEKEAKLLGVFLDLSMGCIYGGVGYDQQERMLRDGLDIVIGTPGRILDFEMKGLMPLKKVNYFIIDEADRLFDMGFYPDVRRMLRKMPPRTERQTMLFSATLDYRVRTLAMEHMNDPATVEIMPEKITVEAITQELYHVGIREKTSLLLGIFDKYKPVSCIIFTNMKITAEELAARLSMNGIKCEYLMGDLPQSKRSRIIENAKSGLTTTLIATDVAARGLHVEGLDLVVNFDIPQDMENYVHRIGRTARAGKSGRAVTFACENYVEHLSAIEKYIGIKIPVAWADDDMYLPDASAHISGRTLRGQSDHDRGGRSSGGRSSGGSRDGRSSSGSRSGGSRTSGSSSRPGSSGGSRYGSSHGSSDRSRGSSMSPGERRYEERHERHDSAAPLPRPIPVPVVPVVPPIPEADDASKRKRKRGGQKHRKDGSTVKSQSHNRDQHEGKPTIIHKIAKFLGLRR